MRDCPRCGYRDSLFWKPLFWRLYWEYMALEDFRGEYPGLCKLVDNMHLRTKNVEGDFWFDFEDEHYYYRIAGKTRLMIHRFPKGYESLGNKKLFEKTPSEKTKT